MSADEHSYGLNLIYHFWNTNIAFQLTIRVEVFWIQCQAWEFSKFPLLEKFNAYECTVNAYFGHLRTAIKSSLCLSLNWKVNNYTSLLTADLINSNRNAWNNSTIAFVAFTSYTKGQVY